MPKAAVTDATLITGFEVVKQIVAGVRTIRLEHNIPTKPPLALHIVSGEHDDAYNPVIMKMCNLETITRSGKNATSASFMVGTAEFAVPLGNAVNVEEEKVKIEAEIKYLEGLHASIMKKLGNEKFVANAAPEIVAKERKKQTDTESKLQTLRESIVNYEL
jgi:valyl-tRNA synthetase